MLACEKEKLVGVKNYCKDQETTSGKGMLSYVHPYIFSI